ncbi:MAG: DNA internalization-related competence protein ComEC/Rec2 [Pseudomonadota bacterium]
MRLNALSFVLGAWLLQNQAALPDMAWAGLVALPWLVAWLGARRLRASKVTTVLFAGGFVLAGFFWAAWLAQARLADALLPAWEGRDIQLVGVVAGLPQAHERGLRFELDVEEVLTPDAHVPHRLGINWYADGRKETPFPSVHAGERWRLTVRLKQPHGTANPYAFDYEAWLLERNIRATGYVRADPGNARLDTMAAQPRYWIAHLRESVRARIASALPDAPYAGVLVALAIGDQQAISATQWRVFTRTGVNHLMSISGLHVTLFASLAFAVVYWLWRSGTRLALRLPAQKAAAVAGLLAALAYALLAGYQVPAQRTVYMLAVAAAALWLGRASAVSHILCAALFMVVLLDPWAVLAPGFWLSFGAVALILYVSVARLREPHWFAAWGRAQWAVTLGLVPLLLGLFQQISLVSPLANAVSIPLVSFVVVPLTLLGVATPFAFPFELAHQAMAGVAWLLEILSALPAAVWQQHAPPAWALLVACAGIAWMLLPRGFPARWAGAVGLLPLFFMAPSLPAQGEAWLNVLDVGQGLAVVVQTRDHALLYDAGPDFSGEADSGNRIVVPFLRGAGIARLDGMIVSHDDQDHSGGAASVLQALPLDWFASSLPLDHALLGAACCASSRRMAPR